MMITMTNFGGHFGFGGHLGVRSGIKTFCMI